MITPNLDEILREYADGGGSLEVEEGARRELDVLQGDRDSYVAVNNLLTKRDEQIAALRDRLGAAERIALSWKNGACESFADEILAVLKEQK